jgi:hypothetical protein
MKTIKNYRILILPALTLVLLSCSNKNDDSTSPDNVGNILTQGGWKVSYYNNSGKDETYKYDGYTFQFNAGGTITATNGSNTHSGTWSTGTDDSRQKLYLSFGAVVLFESLNDDWYILEQNSSVITLEDISGGNGGTDYLTFTKI